MTTPSIGVLAVQGDVREHRAALEAAGARTVAVRRPDELATLDGLEAGELRPVPQPTDGVSHAGKLTVDDARVRWTDPALAVDRHIRSVTPAPGAWTTLNR